MPEPRPGRPEAAAAIWRWRETAADVPVAGAARRARLLGGIQGLVGACVGAALFAFWSRTVGSIAMGLAATVLLASLVSPLGVYAGIQRLFEATGHAVGRVTTWLVMVPLFYLFFLPFGLVMRRGRRDAMKRFFDRDADTYWEPHPQRGAAAWERQY